MKKTITNVALLILCIMAVGCSARQYIKTSYSEDSCNIHVFRDEFTLVYAFDVEIDGKAYAKLSDKTYTNIYIPAGKHTVSAKWFPTSGGVDIDVPFTCKPKDEAFIAFSGNVEGSIIMTRKINSFGLSKEEALTRISSYEKIGE